MLITLCYLYMWVRFHKCYSVVIRNRLSKPKNGSFTFSVRSSAAAASLTDQTAALQDPPEDNIFLQLGDKAVYVTEPRLCDDLSRWTVLLGSSRVSSPQKQHVSFIIESTGHGKGNTPNTSEKKVLKWSDFCLPLACSPGLPFSALAQASVDDFSRLGVAFIEDRLQLDDGLLPSKIVSIVLQESTLSEFLDKLHLGPVGDSGPHFLGNHHTDHGHHLHLSSCNECLELENSTIASVKYSSAENIADISDDNSVCLDSGDGTLDKPEHYSDNFFGTGLYFNGKPPNILVYTGGCHQRFQDVCQVLSECINMENNIIYPIQPHQALNDPWLDNTRLLVLAEEDALSPELQTRFLTYLSLGGRILGLASSLCPAGLTLEKGESQSGQIKRLSFIKEDNTEMELSVLASGNVYIRDPKGGGQVELWGELKGNVSQQRNMVIVRVTHGEDGGEAVLCQVHLEVAPDKLTSEGFDTLKVSNRMRYEVLTEILCSFGLSCKANQTPAPSPVHLLAVSKKAKARFLSWLQSKADQTGLITMSRHSFKMVSTRELQEGPLLCDRPLDLITDSSESQSCLQFSMETYKKNLKTNLLGHTVMYADVSTSTMDLLEGLNLQVPKEVGLIAIAGQQTKGKGRGRNAWLSPLGCAMFTLNVQVELTSKLGRKIPFLQHLAALAVVEAVRSLPGYEDIDLRVKWPNDIYYSNLMKLGGVLVTSSMIGSTFHLLIGCGINVTNRNPTICINDLIQKHNMEHNSSLQLLSCAQLIARTVSCLEALIGSFQRGGPDAVLPVYYKRWLHSGTRVHLWSENGLEAEVVGLDQNGFLQVFSKELGVVSVEPDGNSFDMTKNLVVFRPH